jgi:glycosyltransferase involved in cell wall biosynthesis
LSKKWKILFTIPNFDTAGSGKALLNIAIRLDKKYFEPHIACLHDQGKYFKIVERSGIPIHIFQFTDSMKGRLKGVFQCWNICKEMKKINPHLIHSFHYGPDYSETLAARMAGIPWIFTKKNMNWGGKSKNGWRLRSSIASYILAQNMDMMREFFPHRKNVSLVPRGVDIDEFLHIPKDIELMHKYKISEHEKVILTVANLVPVKGIEILLDAFQALSHDSVRLLIVGDKDSDYGLEMEKKASHSACLGKIHFIGRMQDVKNYYSIADVFVLPTRGDDGRGEGSPVALLEAMASGIPVIASNVPGSKDILAKISDHLFTPNNVSELLNKLNWIFSLNSGRINTLIQDQLKIIKADYSIEREVRQHEKIYSECLNL